jgi:GNAT superfamily N-acetyltransferase
MPDETPRERVPDRFDPAVSTSLATTQQELAVWMRVFRAGYYNTELLAVDPDIVKPLVIAALRGEKAFVTANYELAPLGAARLGLRNNTAEIEAVVTAPLWHGMGLESALIGTSVHTALERGASTVFSVAPPGDFIRLYRNLGFIELTQVLTYWLSEDRARRTDKGEEER